jgi:hypothetical protein
MPPSDTRHDPGPELARRRADEHADGRRVLIEGADVRVGTAGWTDKTLTASGVFYPSQVKKPEDRLRYYASRFSLVEADMGFYAIPDRSLTERWVERTPPDFVFNVKAHALMTGHATDVRASTKADSGGDSTRSGEGLEGLREGLAPRGSRPGLASIPRRDGAAAPIRKTGCDSSPVRALDSPEPLDARRCSTGPAINSAISPSPWSSGIRPGWSRGCASASGRSFAITT